MQANGVTRKPDKTMRRSLLTGVIVVALAVVFTAAYSRRASESGGVAASPPSPAAAAARPGGTQAEANARAAASAAAASRTIVSFRLDRAVTSGLFLGERWVSPAVFHFAQPGTQYVVQAKLQSVDAQDDYVDLDGSWSTDDPEMIAITRNEDGGVTLRVRRAGEARVFAASGKETKALGVQARRTADAMDVVISQ